jgi:hypothetical protein
MGDEERDGIVINGCEDGRLVISCCGRFTSAL